MSFFDRFKDQDHKEPGKIVYLNDAPESGDWAFTARVEGLVQGVGFRYSTQAVANDLGMVGRVVNQADGSVYVEASGPQAQAKDFIKELALGPAPSSQVQLVQIEFTDQLDLQDTFTTG